MTETPWRPQVLWLPMGGLLGAASGVVTGIVRLLGMVVLAPRAWGGSESVWTDVVVSFLAGGWYRGIAGLVVGCLVGVEPMFLVGAHLPRDVARRRAYWWGYVLPPLTMVSPFVVLNVHDLSMPDVDEAWWLVPLAGASVLGSRQARWLAGFQPAHPPVS